MSPLVVELERKRERKLKLSGGLMPVPPSSPGVFCPGALLAGGTFGRGIFVREGFCPRGLLPGGTFVRGLMPVPPNFNAYTYRLGFLCLAS